MLSRAGMRANMTRIVSRSVAPVATRANSNLPPSYEKFPPGPRPDGVPDTWQANHIDSDQGFFEDDVFPPALAGETLEEYCRRVPNIWSPCSRSTDVVDVRVSTTLEFSQDINMEDHQFSERPLIKIPPLDSDWHDANEMEVKLANPPDPYTINGIVPAEIHPEEAEEVCRLILEGAQRVGYGHWFESDNFVDFWIELTGKHPTEMPFEKTMDRLLEVNPGMSHLDIERRFIPNIGKDEWFFGADPRMTERDIMMNKAQAKEIEAAEASVAKELEAGVPKEETGKLFSESLDAYDKSIDQAIAAGEFKELMAAFKETTTTNENGEVVVKEGASKEQVDRFYALLDAAAANKKFGFEASQSKFYAERGAIENADTKKVE